MTISATTSNNKNKSGLQQVITRGEMAYACARNQHQIHNLLVRAVKDSGLTQKELANLTKIDEATLSRLLSRPRNLELDTLSKLIYGASGATLNISIFIK